VQELENETSIKLFLVDASINKDRIKDQSLKVLPGTMQMHQLWTDAPGHLM
jgi:hypothetical protein